MIPGIDCGNVILRNAVNGRVLSDQFFQNRDWPVTSSVAIFMLALLVVPTMLFQRFEKRTLEASK
jgi:putrescine transport system permease protein